MTSNRMMALLAVFRGTHPTERVSNDTPADLNALFASGLIRRPNAGDREVLGSVEWVTTAKGDRLARWALQNQPDDARPDDTKPRSVGRKLVESLSRLNRPVAEIVSELEATEAVRRAEWDGKTKKQKRAGADDWVPDIDAWTALTEEVSNLPTEIGVALMTGRPQLILGMSPDRLAELCRDTAQVRGIIDLVRVLLITNAMLQLHCARVADRVEHMRDALTGLGRTVNRVATFANFQEAGEDDEADEG